MYNTGSLFLAEFIRLKSDYRFYSLDYVFTHINFLILISGLFLAFFGQHDNMSDYHGIKFLFSITIWYTSLSIIIAASQAVSEEILYGTINQIILSRVPITKIFLIRMTLHALLSYVLIIIYLLIILLVLGQVNLIQILYKEFFVFLFLLFNASIAVIGIGFVIAGTAFKFKRVNALTGIIGYIFLFFTNSFVDLDNYSNVLGIVSRIIPLTWANNFISSYLKEGVNLFEFLPYYLSSLLYLFLGVSFFSLMLAAYKKG
jgi:ABC-type multidrug transport system permease subunit